MPKAFQVKFPLSYSFQGYVEYEKERVGHYWQCIKKEKWELIKDRKSVPFTTNAKLVKDILGKLVKDPQFTPSSKNESTALSFLNWLLNKKVKTVSSPIPSMVLNTVIKGWKINEPKKFEVITSVCDGPYTINVRDLPSYTPCWFYNCQKAEDYVADFLLYFDKKDLEKMNNENTLLAFLDELRFIRSLQTYTLFKEEALKNKLRVKLRVNCKIIKYIRGQVCGCLPIPGKAPKIGELEIFSDEPEAIKSPEIVVSSPVVKKTLEKLSRIWQDTFACTVLISAPPGSGKEDFTKSIPYGNGRPTENFQIISMADCDMGSLQRRLYGYEEIGRVYAGKHRKPQRNEIVVEEDYERGLIELAKGSALFLDEIHQPGPSQEQSVVRASLLRTLEAKEYFAVNGTTPRKVDKVLFVMATSIPLGKLGEYNPPDFWTRMDHVIEIPHPLSFSAFDEKDPTMSDVVSNFFSHFWWTRIEEFYGMKPVFGPPQQEILSVPQKTIVFWQVHSMTQVMGFKCRNKDEPSLVPMKKTDQKNFSYRFAEVFNECLSNHPNIQEARYFSIRGIRNMVSRLFSIAASNVEKGQSPWETKDTKDKDSFTKDVEAAFRGISQAANLR